MRHFRTSFALGFASVSLALGASAGAQDAATDPYQEMVEVFAGDTMRDLAFESTMKTGFRGALEADPEIQELEIECPGFVSGAEEAVRPIMKASHIKDYVVYRQDLYALFESSLSVEHAGEAAAFWSSDLGMRFFNSVFANQTLDNTVAEAVATEGEENISAEAIRKDNDRTAILALMAMEPVDRQEITRIFASEPWAQTFSQIRPQINALLADPKYQTFTPEEDKAIEEAADTFAQAHFTACFGEEES